MSKLIHNAVASDDFTSFSLPPGKYKGLYLHYSGTNDTGDDVAASQLGNFTLLKEGRQIQRWNIDRIQAYNNLKRGVAAAASATAGAYNFSCYVPFHLPGDVINCLDASRPSEYTVELNSFSDADIASGTVEVYAVYMDGIHQYHLDVRQLDFNAVAGSSIEALRGVEQIYEILIANSSDITRLGVKVDGDVKIEAALQQLIDLTHQENALETFSASTPYLDLILAQSGALGELLALNVELQYTTGSAITPLAVVTFAADFSPEKAKASAATTRAKVQAKLNNQKAMGITRPARVLEQVA